MAIRSSDYVKQVRHQIIKPLEKTSILIRAGEREKAIQVLKDWFEQKVRNYLKICDPFFGPDDLEVLKLLRSVNSSCVVHVLTSRKHHNSLNLPWEDAYRTYWKVNVSDQAPPDTEIVIVGTAFSQESPIHDRWWLTDNGGIRMGTSFNSLGGGKDSEISYLIENEAEELEAEIDLYLTRTEREHQGEKLHYTLFTL